MVLLTPSTVMRVSTLSIVILLFMPPIDTVAQVPVTVNVFSEPPTLSDLPSAQSSVVVVPRDP
jgi:hypothetical protein